MTKPPKPPQRPGALGEAYAFSPIQWMIIIPLFLAGLTMLIEPAHETDVQGPPTVEVGHAIPLMGTNISIKVRAHDEAQGKRAIEAAFKRAIAINAALSTYIPKSEISALNQSMQSSPSTPIGVSTDLSTILEQALALSAKTGGAFDPTVKPLVNLWKQAKSTSTLPTQDAINRVKPNYKSITLKDAKVSGSSAFQLDFGAIGKGFAGDEMAKLLQEHGITDYLIDVGQDVLCSATDKPWRVGIQHPLKLNALISIVETKGMAIASSGDYRQRYTIDGKSLTHIVDPRTGWPIQHIAGATVITPSSTMADALATALCVLEPEKSLALIESMENTECLIMQHHEGGLKVFKSSGWLYGTTVVE